MSNIKISKEQINDVITFLCDDELKNINLINFIENNPITSIERIENTMLVRGISDRSWVYVNCDSRNDFAALRKLLNNQDKCFGAIEEWMIPELLGGRNVLWELSLTQYYLPDEVNLPKPTSSAEILSVKDAETIYENSNYKDYISIDYIKSRIRKGISRGIFINGKLVAWGLTQDDGGLGFLHVLDIARRKGYGLSVTISLIEDVRRLKKPPFAYIEKDNIQSINLVKKLGFIRQDNRHWFEIE